MPLEIIRTISYTDTIHVYHNPSDYAPSVGISFGPLFTHIKPLEARELADALIDAANAATRPAEVA